MAGKVVTDVQSVLAQLEARFSALEEAHKKASDGSSLKSLDKRPPHAQDAFSAGMYVLAVAAGFRDTIFARVPSDYYDWKLEQRRHVLGAVSTAHLTKTVVLRDHKHTGEHRADNGLKGAKFVAVVVQYGRRVHPDLLARASGRRANFRLADDCEALTSYAPNAVTPLGLRIAMPLVVDEAVAALTPAPFWLGGGEVDLKWRVDWKDFAAAFNPVVVRVSVPELSE